MRKEADYQYSQGPGLLVPPAGSVDVFNRVASGYDREALRVFACAAGRLIARLKPSRGRWLEADTRFSFGRKPAA